MMPVPIRHFQTIEPRHWISLGFLSYTGMRDPNVVFDRLKPQADWCEENCSGLVERGWFEVAHRDRFNVGFMFTDEADAMAFKLAWT